MFYKNLTLSEKAILLKLVLNIVATWANYTSKISDQMWRGITGPKKLHMSTWTFIVSHGHTLTKQLLVVSQFVSHLQFPIEVVITALM